MCSETGMKDFPIEVSIPVSETLYKTVEDLNFPLEVQWAPKATAPSFLYSGQVANLGFTDFGLNTASSLRLKGNSFSHLSTQLCQSLHRGFLPFSDAKDCSGELIMSFRSTSTLGESYVFVCVPLLARSTANPSLFLTALDKQTLPNRPLQFTDYLPQRGLDYISYVTCCAQVKAKKTESVSIRVIVFVKGIEVAPNSLNSLASKTNKPPLQGSNIRFSPVFLPDGIVPLTGSAPYIISTEGDFKAKLLYARYLPSAIPSSKVERIDSTSSYKCVPLDPERNIKDNKIKIDTTSGELLTDVVKERKQTEAPEDPLFTPAKIQFIAFVSLAFIATLFILAVLGTIIVMLITDDSDTTVQSIIGEVRKWPATMLLSFMSVIIGLIIGIYIKSF